MRKRVWDWYYVRVVRHAWTEALPHLKEWGVVEALTVLIASLVVLAVQGWPDSASEWLILFAPLLGVGGAVVLMGVVQIVRAPVLLDRSLRTANEDLRAEVAPHGAIGIESRIFGREVYLLITNDGPSNVLVAQVTEAKNTSKDYSLPWSMIWRGWDGEERPVAEGAAHLLVVGDLTGSSTTEKETGDNVLRYYYHLHSGDGAMGARFSKSSAPVRRHGKDVSIQSWEEVPAIATHIPRLVSLLVEVRATQPHYKASMWVHLGFEVTTPSAVPIVELEPTQPGEHSDEPD